MRPFYDPNVEMAPRNRDQMRRAAKHEQYRRQEERKQEVMKRKLVPNRPRIVDARSLHLEPLVVSASRIAPSVV